MNVTTKAQRSRKPSRSSQPRRRSAKQKPASRPRRWLWVVSVVLLALFVGLVAYLYTGKPGHRGLDVSHHQGKIDWERVAFEGDVEFVYIKATQGLTFTDPAYQENHDQARRHGIQVGAYHFFEANRPGAKQFDHYARIVGNDIDLVPVLDLESSGGKISDLAVYHSEVKAWIDACRKYYGRYPVLYSNPSFVRDNHLESFLAYCPYWIAWYVYLPASIASHRTYLDLRYPDNGAMMWQFTERGSHSGIEGNVDIDECWDMQQILF